jgi:Zn-dependent M28 family amino/carboxypeptidase
MTRNVCLWLLVLNAFGGLMSQENGIAPVSYLKYVIGTIAHDSFKGRAVSSAEELKTADFIRQAFLANGGKYCKYHRFKYRVSDTAVWQSSLNVYCFVNNKADSTILIGAHYDHIGLGGKLSFAYGKKDQIHNGADDNASGVAMILHLFKTRSVWMNKNYNYLFVAYSAHEIGLYGSEAFAKMMGKKFKAISLTINFDMVGRLDQSYPVLEVCTSNPIQHFNHRYWDQELIDSIHIRRSYDHKLVKTDAGNFLKYKIPSVSFTTGIHQDYHKPSDDASEINYAGILKIQAIIESYLKLKPTSK